MKMIEDSYKADYVPEPKHVKRFFENSRKIAENSNSETEWYDGVIKSALNWLSISTDI
jgi:hypothetical protein